MRGGHFSQVAGITNYFQYHSYHTKDGKSD